MKLSNEVMFEIIDIVREGLAEEKDISQMLRDIDLEVKVVSLPTENLTREEACLTEQYKTVVRPTRGWSE